MKFKLILLITLLVIRLEAQNENQDENASSKVSQVIADPALTTAIQPIHNLAIYPTLENMVKNVIFLDPMADESLLKVEFYAVKSQEVDECNKHILSGDFEIKNLEGYGYPYYIFNSNSQVISTKMGCGNDIKKIKNVPSGKTETVRYLSIMPIVVYTPKEVDLKYFIWRKDPNELNAKSY